MHVTYPKSTKVKISTVFQYEISVCDSIPQYTTKSHNSTIITATYFFIGQFFTRLVQNNNCASLRMQPGAKKVYKTRTRCRVSIMALVYRKVYLQHYVHTLESFHKFDENLFAYSFSLKSGNIIVKIFATQRH